MSKIKMSKIISAIAVMAAGFMFVKSGVVLAATEPGCYVQYSSSSTTRVTCPTEGLARDTSATSGKCYLSADASRDRPASSFKETACTAIVAVPSSTTSGPSLEPGFEGTLDTGDQDGDFWCGKGEGNEISTSFDFGCRGKQYECPAGVDPCTLSPIMDIAFAIFRFLSIGVGLVIIGTIIVAGIQYTTSRGDPAPTAAAINRISNSLIALLIYIFIFAIANYLVPGGMFL